MSNELIELAKKDRIQNQHGCTSMHRAPVEDDALTTPLHRAAVNGDTGVITEIVCSESLAKLTSNDETALILAVKNSQIDAFKILMEETKKHNLERLFTTTDKEGNSLLHLAAQNKLTSIVNLLLESSYSHIIQINSKNNEGQTALDICNANSQDDVSKEICSILERAAARQQSARDPEQISDPTSGSWNFTRFPIETRNVILMVLGMIATAFFTAACNFPNGFVKGNHPQGQKFDAKDVISGNLPTVVYLMVFSSAGFMTAMAAITVLVWALQLRSILLFLVICICVVYVMLVDEVTPKFSVSVGKFSISSIALMWSLVAALSLTGISILSMREKCTSSLWRFIVWLSMKRANWWGSNTVEDSEASSIGR
ncbi:hypothetical protein KPL70_025359 [Citrus sinensis]|nr:uncharacterized protein LOC18031424 [Citrus x clementina]XP_006490183.2 uncharacterized protein LOC102624733 [Citrus sinensis]KAH9647864.1 hypothetical protein KPL70_025359 [Citrus sinensis]